MGVAAYGIKRLLRRKKKRRLVLWSEDEGKIMFCLIGILLLRKYDVRDFATRVRYHIVVN